MTMKQFSTAARRGTPGFSNTTPVEFMWDDRTMVAQPPTTGQLALFSARQAEGGLGGIRSMFELLASILDEDDYRVIEKALQDGIDLLLVTEVVQYIIGEWSGRPTSASTGSSTSRRSTGARSTAKRRAAVSTTSL